MAQLGPSSATPVEKPRDTNADAAGRERLSLNTGWRFSRFTSNPDSLSYNTLKPYMLPAANEFISATKYNRPTGTQPGSNVNYVKDSFDDSSWEAVDLPLKRISDSLKMEGFKLKIDSLYKNRQKK